MLHPDSLIAHADTLVDTENLDHAAVAYSSARAAMVSVYGSMADVESAVEACSGPVAVGRVQATGKPILTTGVLPERQDELRGAMGSSFSRVAANVDASLGTLDGATTKLQAEVDAVLKPKADTPLAATEAAQIRDHIKAMKDTGERMSFLNRAIVEEKDTAVAHAVLNASPWLSGLTPKELSEVRSRAAAALAPRSYKQLQAAKAVREHLSAALSNYVTRYSKLLPPERVKPVDQKLKTLRG
jgi:hypothetical protein